MTELVAQTYCARCRCRWSSTYTYDAAGRIATMTNYFNNAYSYDWTDRGELERITRGTRVWEFAYNALGQRTQYTHPNGTRTEYAYDTWHRLVGMYHKDASTNAVLDSFEYTLNNGNEITQIDHADGGYWQYMYDARGRNYLAMRYDPSDYLSHWYANLYDDSDNMTDRVYHRTSDMYEEYYVYGYNAGNEQTSMTLNQGTPETRTYDAWGRLATRTQGSYSAAYAYRYGDRLYQVTSNFPGETNSPVYEYGGDGKLRMRGTVPIKYGLGFNPVNERSSLYTARGFVYEPHKAVSERLAQYGIGWSFGQSYYYHDHLGSVRRTRDSNKASVALYEYEPYGKAHDGAGAPFIFALHPYESGMGAYHAPYRNYSPASARWTTVDPLGMVDGPNMYGYVGGNPINELDPYGECIMLVPILGIPLWKLILYGAGGYIIGKWGWHVVKTFTSKQKDAMDVFNQNRLTVPTKDQRDDQINRKLIDPVCESIGETMRYMPFGARNRTVGGPYTRPSSGCTIPNNRAVQE